MADDALESSVETSALEFSMVGQRGLEPTLRPVNVILGIALVRGHPSGPAQKQVSTPLRGASAGRRGSLSGRHRWGRLLQRLTGD
jgi:hypothetical protein